MLGAFSTDPFELPASLAQNPSITMHEGDSELFASSSSIVRDSGLRSSGSVRRGGEGVAGPENEEEVGEGEGGEESRVYDEGTGDPRTLRGDESDSLNEDGGSFEGPKQELHKGVGAGDIVALIDGGEPCICCNALSS